LQIAVEIDDVNATARIVRICAFGRALATTTVTARARNAR